MVTQKADIYLESKGKNLCVFYAMRQCWWWRSTILASNTEKCAKISLQEQQQLVQELKSKLQKSTEVFTKVPAKNNEAFQASFILVFSKNSISASGLPALDC